MPDTLISALVQAPFVLAMAYLVQRFLTHINERDQEWQQFIERTDDVLAERMGDLTEAVNRLSLLIVAHDARMHGLNPETPGSTEELVRAVRGGR